MNRRKFFRAFAAATAAVTATHAGASHQRSGHTVLAGDKIYRSRHAPHALGDLWIDTAHSNKAYKWNGTAWVTPDAV